MGEQFAQWVSKLLASKLLTRANCSPEQIARPRAKCNAVEVPEKSSHVYCTSRLVLIEWPSSKRCLCGRDVVLLDIYVYIAKEIVDLEISYI